MHKELISRREFVTRSGVAAVGSWLAENGLLGEIENPLVRNVYSEGSFSRVKVGDGQFREITELNQPWLAEKLPNDLVCQIREDWNQQGWIKDEMELKTKIEDVLQDFGEIRRLSQESAWCLRRGWHQEDISLVAPRIDTLIRLSDVIEAAMTGQEALDPTICNQMAGVFNHLRREREEGPEARIARVKDAVKSKDVFVDVASEDEVDRLKEDLPWKQAWHKIAAQSLQIIRERLPLIMPVIDFLELSSNIVEGEVDYEAVGLANRSRRCITAQVGRQKWISTFVHEVDHFCQVNNDSFGLVNDTGEVSTLMDSVGLMNLIKFDHDSSWLVTETMLLLGQSVAKPEMDATRMAALNECEAKIEVPELDWILNRTGQEEIKTEIQELVTAGEGVRLKNSSRLQEAVLAIMASDYTQELSAEEENGVSIIAGHLWNSLVHFMVNPAWEENRSDVVKVNMHENQAESSLYSLLFKHNLLYWRLFSGDEGLVKQIENQELLPYLEWPLRLRLEGASLTGGWIETWAILANDPKIGVDDSLRNEVKNRVGYFVSDDEFSLLWTAMVIDSITSFAKAASENEGRPVREIMNRSTNNWCQNFVKNLSPNDLMDYQEKYPENWETIVKTGWVEE